MLGALARCEKLPVTSRMVVYDQIGLIYTSSKKMVSFLLALARSDAKIVDRFAEAVAVACRCNEAEEDSKGKSEDVPLAESSSSSSSEEEEEYDEEAFSVSDADAESEEQYQEDSFLVPDDADDERISRIPRKRLAAIAQEEEEEGEADAEIDLDEEAGPYEIGVMCEFLRALNRRGWRACLRAHPHMEDIMAVIINAWGRDGNERRARAHFNRILEDCARNDAVPYSTSRSGHDTDVCVFCNCVRECTHHFPLFKANAGAACAALADAIIVWARYLYQASIYVDANEADSQWLETTAERIQQLELAIVQAHADKSNKRHRV